MNILITGIHGFVGLNLVEAFKNENTIFGLDIVNSEIDGVAKTYSCSELSTIPPVDVVIHLAGKSVESNDLSEALEYFETNAGLTRKIFSWFTQSTAKTFIFFSSVKAAADEVHGPDLTEDVEPKPFGTLGESKLLAEKYILDQYVIGKKVYVLRPCIIHGNGSVGNKNMRKLYRWVERGYPLPFGKFECRRSLTSIDNLTFVLKQMLELNIPSGIYNISDDGSLGINEIYEIMGSVIGKKVTIWRVNKLFLKTLSRFGKRFHWYLNDYRFSKLSSNFTVSNEKIKKALNITKMPVSAIEGLSKSIQSYKK